MYSCICGVSYLHPYYISGPHLVGPLLWGLDPYSSCDSSRAYQTRILHLLTFFQILVLHVLLIEACVLQRISHDLTWGMCSSKDISWLWVITWLIHLMWLSINTRTLLVWRLNTRTLLIRWTTSWSMELLILVTLPPMRRYGCWLKCVMSIQNSILAKPTFITICYWLRMILSILLPIKRMILWANSLCIEDLTEVVAAMRGVPYFLCETNKLTGEDCFMLDFPLSYSANLAMEGIIKLPSGLSNKNCWS